MWYIFNSLLTGGARGLGKAIAVRLAQEGCNLAICDINIEEAQRTSEEIRSQFKIACEAFKADVSDTQQVAALYNEIGEKMGTVDILVCEFDQIKILFIACVYKKAFNWIELKL